MAVPTGSVSSTTSHPARNVSPRSMAVRPTLPNRNVTSNSIEDAYVNFILYCNPAVPLDTDSAALAEAFRIPPKSGGKSFSTFTLFELIKQLEAKELKTWAELALKLGVEPPDQEKNESSQKIQQYAVRLKRWMHSMHVDAFFDYLIGRQHPYWTQIPTDPNPVQDEGRDGVAAEDDMALRALLPHIRPRRGRRKPEDDLNKSPSQRPKLDSPSFADGFARPRQEALDPWTAHPDGRNSHPFPFPEQQPPTSAVNGPVSAFPWGADISRSSFSAYPQSAITPSTNQGFWNEAEPRSAITPSKPRSMNRRHGAKVVSSAWRSGGTGIPGKARGRPPIIRNGIDTPVVPGNENNVSFAIPEKVVPTPTITTAPSSIPTPTSASNADQQTPTLNSRPSKPSRLSLQVPERPTGSVRLATPPPVVVVNGENPVNDTRQATDTASVGMPSVNFVHRSPEMVEGRVSVSQPGQFDFNGNDRTNLEELESFFMNEIYQADWFDAQTNRIPGPSMDEAHAITRTVLESLSQQALTKEAFLINVSALAGGKLLMTTTKLRCTRLADYGDHTKYACSWVLRLGPVQGTFTMEETVLHSKWKKPDKDAASTASSHTAGDDSANEGSQSAETWQKKYRDLLAVYQKRDKELSSLRATISDALKESGGQKGSI